MALGKFDALHIGHRELAVQASRIGAPFLLSFVGIAEVLGWEPRQVFLLLFLLRSFISSFVNSLLHSPNLFLPHICILNSLLY